MGKVEWSVAVGWVGAYADRVPSCIDRRKERRRGSAAGWLDAWLDGRAAHRRIFIEMA